MVWAERVEEVISESPEHNVGLRAREDEAEGEVVGLTTAPGLSGQVGARRWGLKTDSLWVLPPPAATEMLHNVRWLNEWENHHSQILA